MALQCFGCICIIIAHAILQQIWIDNMLSHDVPRRETDSLLLGMRAPKKDSLLLGMRAVLGAVLGAFRYEYIPNFSEARSINKKDFKLKIIIIILFKTDLLTDMESEDSQGNNHSPIVNCLGCYDFLIILIYSIY